MKIIAIINPASGKISLGNIINAIKSSFEDNDCELEIKLVQGAQTVKDLADKAVEGRADIIIAAGGDGTVSEIASSLINKDIKLGILPIGTANLLALNLGIPLNIYKALKVIKKNHVKSIDIGEVNGRHFTLVAGCGYDSRIIESTTREHKKRFGFIAYICSAFFELFRTTNMKFWISLDRQKSFKVKATSIIIANTAKIFGDVLSLAPKASFTDGKLDLMVISSRGLLDFWFVLLKMIMGRHYDKSPQLKYYQAKEIIIRSNKKYFIQIDGDICGTTPIKAKILPSAINVLMPKTCSSGPNELIYQNLNILLSSAMKSLRKVGF